MGAKVEGGRRQFGQPVGEDVPPGVRRRGGA